MVAGSHQKARTTLILPTIRRMDMLHTSNVILAGMQCALTADGQDAMRVYIERRMR
jgi:hypothetical protein